MDLLAALILIAIGAAALFVGFKLWLVLLPIFGIVVGAAVAVVFAFLAIFWWWLGVILVIAGFGFAIGYGLLPAIGLDADVLSWVIGLTVAAIFVVAAVVLRMPRALVIVVTSLWGSGAVLARVLVILNQIDVEDLGFGAINQVISESFFWFMA